jgi:hypothetical protein
MDEQITEILDGFKNFDGKYKRDLIDRAVELKDEITPHLINILKTLRDNPEPYLENDIYFDHNYALMLLGHFKETKAHNVIVDLFSLPDDIPDRLFGETVTEDLPVILIRTCGGSVKRTKELIMNKDADDYCRISAMQALVYAVVEGYEQRESVLSFLCGLFTGTETDQESDFWGFAAMSVRQLYPDAWMDTIKGAYDNRLIAPGLIRYESFEKTLNAGKDKALYDLKKRYADQQLDDIHKSMSWWACFDKDEQTPSDTEAKPPGFSQGKQVMKQKMKKKKKRKMAKKSKRRNR